MKLFRQDVRGGTDHRGREAPCHLTVIEGQEAAPAEMQDQPGKRGEATVHRVMPEASGPTCTHGSHSTQDKPGEAQVPQDKPGEAQVPQDKRDGSARTVKLSQPNGVIKRKHIYSPFS